jgi:hypothetical protein
VANTRASAEMEVQLCKELLETKHRLAQLEPAWEMFIARHNEEEDGGSRLGATSSGGGGGATF